MDSSKIRVAEGSVAPQEPPAPESSLETSVPLSVRDGGFSAGEDLSGNSLSCTPACDRQAGQTAKPRSPRRKSGGIATSIQSLAITLVVAFFVITFIVQAFQIPSESMENTLLIGDYLLVDKVQFAPAAGVFDKILPYQPIRRGDIIVFHYPVNPEQFFVKRVIGLPGDRVHLKDKQVFINGRPLRERYAIYRSPAYDRYRDDFPQPDFPNNNVETRWWLQMRGLVSHHELVVPPNQYFVLGDNRDESLDSRFWGFVPRQNITGRPLLIYWSMRRPRGLDELTGTIGDRLFSFTYTLTHLLQQARWNRTFRLVR